MSTMLNNTNCYLLNASQPMTPVTGHLSPWLYRLYSPTNCQVTFASAVVVVISQLAAELQCKL